MAIARTRKRAWPGPGVLSSIRQRGLALLSWELIYGAKMWKERNGSARLITAEVHDAQLAKSLQASIGHGAFFLRRRAPKHPPSSVPKSRGWGMASRANMRRGFMGFERLAWFILVLYFGPLLDTRSLFFLLFPFTVKLVYGDGSLFSGAR